MIKHLLLSGGKLATGIAIKKFLEFIFDYGFYPASLAYFGYLYGGIIMTAAAVILNIILIKLYDLAETDWLLIEEIKMIRDHEDVKLPGILNYLKPLLQKGDVLAFFVLCADDPVTTVLYLRKGSNLYNGLKKRDWCIFVAANIVANLYWIGAIVVTLETIKEIF